MILADNAPLINRYRYTQPTLKLSDMIDALIKRVSVTCKCYEIYVLRGKKVQLLVF
jgi:hypothetical protein